MPALWVAKGPTELDPGFLVRGLLCIKLLGRFADLIISYLNETFGLTEIKLFIYTGY